MDANQKEFELLIKQSPVAITLMEGESLNLKVVNETALIMMGKTEPEVKGKSLGDVFPELNEQLNFYKSVYESGLPFEGKEVELKFNRLGEIHTGYYDLNFKPWLDSEGNIKGVMGVCVDVSKNVCDRKKIEERERLYEAITQNTPDLIYVLDLNYRFTYANNALLKMWGRSWDESIGKNMIEIGYEPWQAELHEGELDQVIETKKPVRGEIPFPHATLGMRRYDYIFVPVIDGNGHVEAIAGTTRDITEIKKAQENLKESENRFALMVEQAPVSICVLKGENHVIEIVNQNQLEIWGKTKEQVLNLPLFTAMPEGAGQGFEELLSGVFETGVPVVQNELPFILPRNGSKETFYANFVYKPLYNVEGQIEGIVSVVTDVTEQVLARKKVEQSEAKYKSLIESAPMAIGIFRGRDLIIESPNEAFIKTVGKGPDIVGKPLAEVMPELKEQGQPYLKILNDVFNTGIMYWSYGDPVKIVQNGVMTETYFDISYIPLFDENGKVYAILDIAADVTEKIESQKKIEESEKRFRELADDSPIFVFIIEPSAEASMSYWNKTWLQYTGQSMEEAIGNAWAGFIHEDDLPSVMDIYVPAFNERQPYLIPPIRTKRHDGEYRWFSYKANPRYLPDGSFVGYVGVGFDVHEQKLAETILSEREEKFRSLVQTLPQLVLVTDHNGTVEFASFRWKEYTGIELVGAKEWLEIIHPEDLDGIGAAWMEGMSLGRFNSFDVRLKGKSGEYMWFTVKGEPVHDKENHIIKWVGAFTETHAEKLFTKELEAKVKERTEELEQFNLELERKNKELQTFAYISSHDLQEPLRKIQTFASRIIHKEYDTLSENGKDNFKRMQDAAHRMQTLIQDLLAYSRTNTKDRNFEKIDLNTFIFEIKEDLSEELKDLKAIIETSDLGYANVIPVQFRQLLQNLISNSLKFSIPDNPPHIKIKSEIATGLKLNTGKLSPQKMYCHISVEDNGIGFEPKYSEKIFEVFQRLHGRNEYKGTGIGLSIVKKIVENHEGIIIAHGQPNKGATFDIYIPA
ncbi:PAS domain S-box protein [Aquiflexum sp. TKW24L]|uniref:PAS domain S-box protein n=1 Tax=Aquiflexum sp. TKW24L TaxID=2942212 RepID=UPI0020BFD263|nr:PAS domain S-box protein [Aquiflexum sp. TKW24L]MCL6261039.1 PAS domain S-box protein [Aquiflexum sp. TKW24L]